MYNDIVRGGMLYDYASMNDMYPTEYEVLNEAIEALNRTMRTGAHWNADINEDYGDGYIELKNIRFPVTIKRNVNQKPAALLAAEMDRFPENRVLVTDYVNPKLAEALRAADLEFMDAAGNVFVDRPGCFALVTGQKAKWDRRSNVIDNKVAFEPAGLKVVYGLLVIPNLANMPYRTIAEMTGAAVGTVGRVINGLEQGRFLTPKKKGDNRELRNYKQLFDRWIEAYTTKLAPKTDIGTFYIEREIWNIDLDLGHYHAVWGGETAAAKYTDYLKPQEHMLYLPRENLQIFLRNFRARKHDPFVNQDRYQAVRLKEKFWTLKDDQEYVNPILVYADLLATDDARNIDTAGILYDQYILPRFK